MKKLLGKASASSHKNSTEPFQVPEDHRHDGAYFQGQAQPRQYFVGQSIDENEAHATSYSESRSNKAQPGQIYTGMDSYSYSQEATPTADYNEIYSGASSAYPSYGGEDETPRKQQLAFDSSGLFNNRSSIGKSSSSFGHAKSSSHSSNGPIHQQAQSYASHGTSSSADDYSFIQYPSHSSGSHEGGLQDQSGHHDSASSHSKGVSGWAAKTFGRINDSTNASAKSKTSKSDAKHLSHTPENRLANYFSEQGDGQSASKAASRPKRVKSLGKSAGKGQSITHWDTNDPLHSPYGVQMEQQVRPGDRLNDGSLHQAVGNWQQSSSNEGPYMYDQEHGGTLLASSTQEETSNVKDKKLHKKSFWAGLTGASSNMTRNDSTTSDGVIDSLDSQAKENNAAKAAWFDLKAKALSKQQQQQSAKSETRPPVYHEGDITAKIGWLCAQETLSPAEWSLLPWLAQTAAQSDASAKEAARAIRKELKWGEPDTQKRAVKIWAFLCFHSSDTFRQQIASKKFLEVIEHTVADPKVSLSVKEQLIEAWAILAYLYKDNADMNSVTKSYNKAKPNDKPRDGILVDIDSHELFRVPVGTSDLQRSSGKGVQKRRSRILLGPGAHAPSTESQTETVEPMTLSSTQTETGAMAHESVMNASQDVVNDGLPTHSHPATSWTTSNDYSTPMVVMNSEDVQELTRACEAARANSSVLIDVITHDPETSTTSESAREFIQQVQDDQELLSSQIQWVSAQADTSRKRLDGMHLQSYDSETSPHASTLSIAAQSDKIQTQEELLLADMLNAIETVSSALAIVEQAREDEREREEERRVTELSKIDFRVDRSALREDTQTGELYSFDKGHGAARLQVPAMDRVVGSSTSSSGSTSTSRAHSPRMGPRPLPSTGDRTGMARQPPALPPTVPQQGDPAYVAGSLAPLTQQERTSAPPMVAVNSNSSQSSAVRLDRPSKVSTDGHASSASNELRIQKPVVVAIRDRDFEGLSSVASSGTHLSEKAMGKRRAVSPTEAAAARAGPITIVQDEWQHQVNETTDMAQRQLRLSDSIGPQEETATNSVERLQKPPALPPMPAGYLAERQLEQNSRNPFRQEAQAHGERNPFSPPDQRVEPMSNNAQPQFRNYEAPSGLAAQRLASEALSPASAYAGAPAPSVRSNASQQSQQAVREVPAVPAVNPFDRYSQQHPWPAQAIQHRSSPTLSAPASRGMPSGGSGSFQVGQIIPREGGGTQWHGARDQYPDKRVDINHQNALQNPHNLQSRNHHQVGDHVKTFSNSEGRLKNPFEY